jgi:hypothetical protein
MQFDFKTSPLCAYFSFYYRQAVRVGCAIKGAFFSRLWRFNELKWAIVMFDAVWVKPDEGQHTRPPREIARPGAQFGVNYNFFFSLFIYLSSQFARFFR